MKNDSELYLEKKKEIKKNLEIVHFKQSKSTKEIFEEIKKKHEQKTIIQKDKEKMSRRLKWN